MGFFNKDNEKQLDALELERLEHEKKQNKFSKGSNVRIIFTTIFIAVLLIVFLFIPMLKADVKLPAVGKFDLSLSDIGAGIVVCFMMLVFTLMVRGSCMSVIFASSNTSRSKFDNTDLKMTQRLKIINENSKRPFITRIYTIAYYAVFLPWIIFCMLGFGSYFSTMAQAAYSKYSFWSYALSFFFIIFNYIFSGFLNTRNSKNK